MGKSPPARVLLTPMNRPSSGAAAQAPDRGITPLHPRGSHVVQFYESEDFLTTSVADFLAEGLATGQPCVAIATERRRVQLGMALRSRGFDVKNLGGGALKMIDAEALLSTFMAGDSPDHGLFHDTVGAIVSHLDRSNPGRNLRAYGEMVDVLWQAGNPDGAATLEEYWNELAQVHSFSLLCAYSMANRFRENHSAKFDRICRLHTHVAPCDAQLPALVS